MALASCCSLTVPIYPPAYPSHIVCALELIPDVVLNTMAKFLGRITEIEAMQDSESDHVVRYIDS